MSDKYAIEGGGEEADEGQHEGGGGEEEGHSDAQTPPHPPDDGRTPEEKEERRVSVRILASDVSEIAAHYDVVVLDYEGCVVNDSYVRWLSFKRAASVAATAAGMDTGGSVPTVSFADWRTDPSMSTLGGFVWWWLGWAGGDGGRGRDWHRVREEARVAYLDARRELSSSISMAPGAVDFVIAAAARGVKCFVRGDATLWSDEGAWLEEIRRVTEAESVPCLTLLNRSHMSDPSEVADAVTALSLATRGDPGRALPPEEREFALRQADAAAFLRDVPGWMPSPEEDGGGCAGARPRRVLWVVDSAIGCEVAGSLHAGVVAAPWGASDPCTISAAYPQVPTVDPYVGYVSLVGSSGDRGRGNSEKKRVSV